MHWVLTGVALLLAALAIARARAAVRRCDRLTDSYWELRYEYGQLRARLTRLEGAPSGQGDADAAPAPDATQAARSTFIPLSTLKR
jgi:hypothetical protein